MTPEQMRQKAMHLQGDYLRAYEDMLKVFKEAEKIANETYEVYGSDPEGSQEVLGRIRHFLNLDI